MRTPASEPDDLVLVEHGLAAFVGSDPGSVVYGTAGSPGYCAPEVLHGLGASRASDIWSLGVTVYSMLVGRTPWLAQSAREINDEASAGVVRYREADWRGVSPAAKDFVARCLALDPHERMTAAEALHHPVRPRFCLN